MRKINNVAKHTVELATVIAYIVCHARELLVELGQVLVADVVLNVVDRLVYQRGHEACHVVHLLFQILIQPIQAPL